MAKETRRNPAPRGGEQKPVPIPPWVIILLLVLPLLLIPMWGASKGETVSYSEFKALLAARKVDSLKVGVRASPGSSRRARPRP